MTALEHLTQLREYLDMPVTMRKALRLDRSVSIVADVYAYGDDEPYAGQTWPTLDGVAVILCPDCGEIDEEGEFFGAGTVYSTWGDPDTCTKDDRCNVCKCTGYVLVGL